MRETAHIEIYQVLDGVLESGVVPPGAKGRVFSVIDRLRANGAGSGELSMAEQVSLGLWRLEQSLRHAQQDEVQFARGALRDLAGQWLDQRINAT